MLEGKYKETAQELRAQMESAAEALDFERAAALRDRLLEINPEANITAYQKIYQAETAEEFHMEEYDYIIDAIDSLKDSNGAMNTE